MQKNTQENTVNIAFLCDESTIAQTAVALYSLIHSKNNYSYYHIFLLCISINAKIIKQFQKIATSSAHIEIIEVDTLKYLTSQAKKPHDITILSLCKFDLANLLPTTNKVLYLDTDIIVQKDLLPLYAYEVDKYYAAVVKEPVIYYWHNELYKNLDDYFNAGVLLFNLANLRRDAMPLKLATKKANPLNRDDKDIDIFNTLMEHHVVFLDITYNFLYTVFLENAKACGIQEINKHYNSNYENLESISKNASIIHFASRYKPWKYANMVYSKTWLHIFKKTPLYSHDLPIQNESFHGKHPLKAVSFFERLKTIFK